MALVLADRVRETTTVTGTGTATLLGAVSGYQSFSAVGNANTTYYVIANQSATEWEIGIGTYTSSGTTLSRDTVLSSSNSGSLVNFSAGTKDVFVDYPASKAVYENAAGNVDGYPITGGTIDNTTIGATTPSTGVFTTLNANTTATFGTTSSFVTPLNIVTSATGNTGRGITMSIGTASFPYARLNVPSGSGGAFSVFVGDGGYESTEQFRVARSSPAAVNYVQVAGAATGGQPTISAQGSDVNVGIIVQSKGNAQATLQSASGNALLATDGGLTAIRALPRGTSGDTWLDVQRTSGLVALSAASGVTNGAFLVQSKGTGAIDLAAGSSGVNISNGGTVTAITRTAFGSGYTSIPTVAISAPTTAGGVQATATASMSNSSVVTITNGGTGYSVNNVLTVQGGTSSVAIQITVSAVSGGVITAAAITTVGLYTVLPTNPVSVTGGTGTGATFTLGTWYVGSTFTITNAGSGYVEQPTVTFSGGGGSGAAAYATVGGTTTIKTVGVSALFNTPGGPAFSIYDTQRTTVDYWEAIGSTGTVGLRVAGATTNNNGIVSSKGTGYVSFQTNSFGQEQVRVTHTASAVNYVQVTGAATSGLPVISAQGSDSAISLQFQTKGTGLFRFRNGSNQTAFTGYAPSGATNFVGIQSVVSGSAPILGAEGTDTNIDLTLTPKGTGNVRFGTYTGTALSIAGYIEIKDSGGTVRKLAVVA